MALRLHPLQSYSDSCPFHTDFTGDLCSASCLSNCELLGPLPDNFYWLKTDQDRQWGVWEGGSAEQVFCAPRISQTIFHVFAGVLCSLTP